MPPSSDMGSLMRQWAATLRWKRAHGRILTDEEERILQRDVSWAADELERLEGILRAIAVNAESWHVDDAAKARALAVIAKWAKSEEAPHPEVARA